MSRITSVDGLFGQKIHYDEYGRYAGESWPGLIPGSMNHYAAGEGYVGYSDPGIAADLVHHDASGRYLGETWQGIQGHQIHYGVDGAGESWDTLTGTDTFFDGGGDLFE